MSTRDALIAHLLEHSIRTGDFTLKSGRKSTWFCDAKQTACRPDGILLVADFPATNYWGRPSRPMPAFRNSSRCPDARFLFV